MLAVLGAINFMLVFIYALHYFSEERDRQAASIQGERDHTEHFARLVEQKLPPIMDIARQIADDLSHGRLDSTALLVRLDEDVARFDYIDGLFVAYEGYKFSETTEFFAPLFMKSGDGHELVFIEYDYTVNDWFKKPLAEGAVWVEPFFGKKSGNILIQYGVPIYDLQQEPIGIVAINFSPRELQKIVSASLPSGESGYGFILSNKGTYIHHPIAHRVQDQQNIADLAELKDVAPKVLRGEDVMVETRDPVAKQKSRIFFESVPSSGWIAGIHFFDERAANDYRRESIRQIWLIIGTSSFLVILIILLIEIFQGGVAYYWMVSIATSLIFIASIYFIWHRTINTPPVEERQENDLMIANESILKHFIEQQNSVAEKTKQISHYVPTGVFVQQIQFETTYNVMVSGYIWQTYSKSDSVYSDGEPISRGFIFAETEPNAEVLDIEEAYRKDLGDREVIGWYFRVSVRENFDYRLYPFDQQKVWLRLWHKDFLKRVVLIPDLASYKITNPVSLPGLEENFVLPNWNLRASYFDYKFNTYNATFGLESEFGGETRPELYFNIVIQRRFLSPFITNIVPLIVVSIIVFTVMMSAKRSATDDEQLGYSGFGVVELCAAFFFIVIISQIEIRDSLQVSDIIYLDYFFFLIYLLLLSISINSILFTRSASNIKFIAYEENLYPKLIYWPLLLGILLIITRIVFY